MSPAGPAVADWPRSRRDARGKLRRRAFPRSTFLRFHNQPVSLHTRTVPLTKPDSLRMFVVPYASEPRRPPYCPPVAGVPTIIQATLSLQNYGQEWTSDRWTPPGWFCKGLFSRRRLQHMAHVHSSIPAALLRVKKANVPRYLIKCKFGSPTLLMGLAVP